MSKKRSRSRASREVSSKQLAEMGFCEKRVLLSHLHGERKTPTDRDDIERGLTAHEAYFREGLAACEAQSGDHRCFVATLLYGPTAAQTIVLRQYRDEVLLNTGCGRCGVWAYYRAAPVVCRVLRGWPQLQGPLRAVFDVVVARCQRTLATRGDPR